jgi:hypothetical protein
VRDAFAPGQFQQLSDSDKLSAPGFEQFDCGVQIGDPSVRGGHDAPRTVTMQWRYIPDPARASVLDRFAALSPAMFGAAVQMGAGALSMAASTGLAKYTGPGTASMLATSPVTYVVSSTDDLLVRADISPAGGATHYATSAALASYLAANPQEAGTLQVMPRHEVPEGQAA